MKTTNLRPFLPVLFAAVLGTGCVSTLHESSFHPESVKPTARTQSRGPYRVSELTFAVEEDEEPMLREYHAYLQNWRMGIQPWLDDLEIRTIARNKTAARYFGVEPDETTAPMRTFFFGFVQRHGAKTVTGLGLPKPGMGHLNAEVPPERSASIDRIRTEHYGWPEKMTADELTRHLASMHPGLFSESPSATPIHVVLAFSYSNRDFSFEPNKGGLFMGTLDMWPYQGNANDPGAGMQTFSVWLLSGRNTPLPVKKMPGPSAEFTVDFKTRSRLGSLFGAPSPSSPGNETVSSYAYWPQKAPGYVAFVEDAVCAAVVKGLNDLPSDLFDAVTGKKAEPESAAKPAKKTGKQTGKSR